MRYATILLGQSSLSVQVRTELLRITGAFINASVQHEARNQRRKLRRSKRSFDDEEDDGSFAIDYRKLEIYCSLNNKVHGAAVYSSPAASTHLGPNLVNTFIAMEAVEGLDVERENHMFKNMVQGEICELILRLWLHPSGQFKRSITSMRSDVLETFLKSVTSAVCIECDTSYQTILDVRDILESRVVGFDMDLQTKASLNSCYGRLPSFLRVMRSLLLLLSYLSQDDGIAALLGDSMSVSSDLGIMFISLLDKFTSADGGTNPVVDFRTALKHNTGGRALLESGATKTELLNARTFARVEFGFDVSTITHFLLALASRWTDAASKRQEEKKTCAIVISIVSHNDFDIQHFWNVYNRLVVSTQEGVNNIEDSLVVKADGYVAAAIWESQYKAPTGISLEESKLSRRHNSIQDQLSHAEINSIANVGKIKSFIEELHRVDQSAGHANGMNALTSEEDIMELVQQINQNGESLTEEGYTTNLQDWLVSSQSFTMASGQMDHFYRSNASSNNLNLGKILFNDARRCWRDLPKPHPNASIFVCYAEERTDICRALISGPTETPYAYGLFLFDVCYPQLYPQAAPMVHFMTTGGGQVRFSPNLYNDGKVSVDSIVFFAYHRYSSYSRMCPFLSFLIVPQVCLSLLGTTTAGDESQRWNPNESSLAQILLSIQSQILDTAEPYFTEGGGHGGLQGTQAGEQGSRRYNNTLRLSTLRHAIINHIKSPPVGFEDVVRRHFAMVRKRLLIQAKVWLEESKDTELHSRFVKAYSELVALLSGENLACEEWEVEEAGGKMFGALPIVNDEDEDPAPAGGLDFSSMLGGSNNEEDNYEDEDEDADYAAQQLEAAMLATALELSLEEN